MSICIRILNIGNMMLKYLRVHVNYSYWFKMQSIRNYVNTCFV